MYGEAEKDDTLSGAPAQSESRLAIQRPAVDRSRAGGAFAADAAASAARDRPRPPTAPEALSCEVESQIIWRTMSGGGPTIWREQIAVIFEGPRLSKYLCSRWGHIFVRCTHQDRGDMKLPAVNRAMGTSYLCSHSTHAPTIGPCASAGIPLYTGRVTLHVPSMLIILMPPPLPRSSPSHTATRPPPQPRSRRCTTAPPHRLSRTPRLLQHAPPVGRGVHHAAAFVRLAAVTVMHDQRPSHGRSH